MGFCYSCSRIRIGERNDGETIAEALDAIADIIKMAPVVGYEAIGTIIPQAKKGGACQNCINELQMLKSEIGKYV